MLISKALGLKSGVVTSSNSLDHNDSDDKIMAENGTTSISPFFTAARAALAIDSPGIY